MAGALFPRPVPDPKPLWKSPKMPGRALDIALGPDPKDSRQTGFLVLETAGEDGSSHTIEFFAVD